MTCWKHGFSMSPRGENEKQGATTFRGVCTPPGSSRRGGTVRAWTITRREGWPIWMSRRRPRLEARACTIGRMHPEAPAVEQGAGERYGPREGDAFGAALLACWEAGVAEG